MMSIDWPMNLWTLGYQGNLAGKKFFKTRKWKEKPVSPDGGPKKITWKKQRRKSGKNKWSRNRE